MIYERPFDFGHDKNNSKYKYKLQTWDKLKRLFAAPGLVVSPATDHVIRPSSRGVRTTLEQPSDSIDKSTSNRGVETNKICLLRANDELR